MAIDGSSAAGSGGGGSSGAGDGGFVELAIFMLFAYIPFLLSETLRLSGIVTTLFCGIGMRRYAAPNLSAPNAALARRLFAFLADLAEASVFLGLGLAMPSLGAGLSGAGAPALLLWAPIAVLLGRLHVYPLSWLSNRWCAGGASGGGAGPLTLPEQHMVWFAGLRGAVAFACALDFPPESPHAPVFLSVTMVIVALSVFGMGGGTNAVLRRLRLVGDERAGDDDGAAACTPVGSPVRSPLPGGGRGAAPALSPQRNQSQAQPLPLPLPLPPLPSPTRRRSSVSPVKAPAPRLEPTSLVARFARFDMAYARPFFTHEPPRRLRQRRAAASDAAPPLSLRRRQVPAATRTPAVIGFDFDLQDAANLNSYDGSRAVQI